MSKLLSERFTEHQYLRLSNDITLILASYPCNITLPDSLRYVEYVLTDGYITEWLILYNQSPVAVYSQYPINWVYDSTGIKLPASDINKISQFINSTRDLYNFYSCLKI